MTTLAAAWSCVGFHQQEVLPVRHTSGLLTDFVVLQLWYCCLSSNLLLETSQKKLGRGEDKARLDSILSNLV